MGLYQWLLDILDRDALSDAMADHEDYGTGDDDYGDDVFLDDVEDTVD